MKRKVKFIPEHYYHIYSRGVEKRKIFLDDNDYLRFLLLLYLTNSTENIRLSNYFRMYKKEKDKNKTKTSEQPKGLLKKVKRNIYELFTIPRKETLVSIITYCQMPNHFHLLIREKKEGGIPKFMGKLLTSFSKYFNIKYERSGSLFVNPFKAKHIDLTKNYFNYLFAYIHLNPVKLIDPKWKEDGIKDMKKAKKFLENYRYSSYLDYLGVERLESAIVSKEASPVDYTGVDFKGLIGDFLGYEDGEL